MTKKIIILLIYILVMLPITVFAGDGAYKATLYISNEALNIISWVGYAIAFGALIFMGIKYLMSAANERANLKGSFSKYLIGVALIVLCSTIALVVAKIAGNEDANKIVDTGFEIGNLTSDGNSSSTGNSGASMGSVNVIFGELPENSDSKDNEEEKPVVKDEEKEEEKEYEEKDETEAVKEVNDKNFLKWEIYSQSSNGNTGSLVGTHSNHIYEQDVIFTSQEFVPVYLKQNEYAVVNVYTRGDVSNEQNTQTENNSAGSANDGTWEIPPEALTGTAYERLKALADSLIGTPYLMVPDANDPAFGSLDCSGFIQYIYKTTGVYNSMPRTAQSQYDATTRISKEDLKPGDLVFFTGTYDTTSAVTHVGMYIGDGMMIDAGSSGVQVRSIEWDYYKEHFYGCGRVEGANLMTSPTPSGAGGNTQVIM